jgi:hypothetical protein
MAGTSYECRFNLDTRRIIEGLGLAERGRVQRVACEEILRLCDSYVPFSGGEVEGHLRDTGHVENNTEIVWNGPYAHYMYEGIVYEDPLLHCAGFKTENGWRSRKNVQKVPSDRRLHYNNGSLRGDHWVDRMMNNGGRRRVEEAVRRAVGQ